MVELLTSSYINSIKTCNNFIIVLLNFTSCILYHSLDILLVVVVFFFLIILKKEKQVKKCFCKMYKGVLNTYIVHI